MSYSEPSVLMYNRTLRIERKRRGWTQARLARAMGVHTRTVIRWEQGIALPHPSHRVRLESLFGKTAEELGLLWDPDENEMDNLMLTKALSLIHQAMPEVAKPASLPVSATIQQTLGKNSCLLGRARVLTQIKESLFSTDHLPVIALYGPTGVGKAALAAALANDPEVQDHFVDGILWAPLGPQPHVLSQLIQWGTQLGVTSSDVENPESLLAWNRALRWAIGTRRILLIIDDVWKAEDALALQVGGPLCTHLLTTRQPRIAHAFTQQYSIGLAQLEEADALALLARYVPQLIQQDPQAAQSLVQALNCLPLALTLIGTALASSTLTEQPRPLQAVLTLLHDNQDYLRLNIPDTSGQQSHYPAGMLPFSLYAAIAICIQQLSQQAQITLGTLAIFPPKPHSFSEEAALEMSQQPRESLAELCDAGLLECRGQGRYSLHQAIAHYGRIRAKLQWRLSAGSALQSESTGA